MTPQEFKAWRVRTRLTQTKAAAVLGVDRRTISRRETGAMKISWETDLACSVLELILANPLSALTPFARPITVPRPGTNLSNWREAMRSRVPSTPGRDPAA